MSNMWDVNSQSYRDRPTSTEEGYEPPYEPQDEAASFSQGNEDYVSENEYDESVITDLMEDEDEEYTDVLLDARLRLEQGRLYEMLMKHDIFGDVDADPQAIKNVQKEMRKYAKDRMEIMLGMRQEQPKAQTMILPFNSLEIDVLKRVASTFSKGATEQADSKAEVRQAPTQPKKEGLNTISSTPRRNNKPTISTQKPQSQIQKKTESALPITGKAPIKRNRLTEEIQKNLAKEGIVASSRDIEIDYKPLDKDPSQMTDSEKIEWLKKNEMRRGQSIANNPNRIPPPSPQQNNAIMERLAQSSAPAMNFGSGSSLAAAQNPLTSQIMNAVIKKHSNE